MNCIVKNSKLRIIIPLLIVSGLLVSVLHLHNDTTLYQNEVTISKPDHFDCLLCDAVILAEDATVHEYSVFLKSEYTTPETSPRLDCFLAKLNRDQRAPPIAV